MTFNLSGLLGGGNTSTNSSSHAGHTSGTSSAALPQYSLGSYGSFMPSYSMPMLGGLGGSIGNLAGSYVSGIGMPSYGYSSLGSLPSYTGFYSAPYMGMSSMPGMMGMGGMSGMGMSGMSGMMGMGGMSGMDMSSYMPTTTSTNSTSSSGPTGSILGQILGIPLGLFSYAVGHDGALKAAQNGDIMGWLVNTQDHSSHSHLLGGADSQGSTAPLAFLGTIGQELGYMLGLDQLFGSAEEYDRTHGTNYTGGGTPTHLLPIWG